MTERLGPEWLARHLGAFEICEQTRHASAAVFRARVDHRDVAIKCAADGTALDREAEVLELVEGRVSAPRLIRREAIDGIAILLSTWRPGIRLELVQDTLGVDTLVDAWAQMGTHLARIHLAIDPERLVAAHFWRRVEFEGVAQPSWSDLVWRRFERWRDGVVLTKADEDAGTREALEWLGAGLRSIADTRSRLTLLHCDYSPRNALWEEASSTVSSIIDFECALIGDPQYDLAKSALMTDRPLDVVRAYRRAFESAWASASGIGFDPVRARYYEAMQGLGAMAWADKRGPTEHEAFRESGRAALLEAHHRE